jgi:hypothetical protein
MTTEDKKLLTEYLKAKGTNTLVLFDDMIDGKLVHLDVWYETSDGNIYIAGDEGQMYEFDELQLADDAVMNFGKIIPDKQMANAEDAIIHIAEALGINEKKLIDIIEDGWKLNHVGTDSNKFTHFLDEMRATHDAY